LSATTSNENEPLTEATAMFVANIYMKAGVALLPRRRRREKERDKPGLHARCQCCHTCLRSKT